MVQQSPPTSAGLIGRIRPGLFWDKDIARLDAEVHAQYIIERVAERGTWEEMKDVWEYYGPECVKAAVQASRDLTGKTVWFFAGLFELPLTAFRSHGRGVNDVAQE